MKRINYEELEQKTTQFWTNLDNTANDPVVDGQKRAAIVAGKLAAFMAHEMDVAMVEDDLSMPFQILGAVVANQINNMAPATEDYERAVYGFLQILSTYLEGMKAIRDGEPSEVVSAAEGSIITLTKVEAPN